MDYAPARIAPPPPPPPPPPALVPAPVAPEPIVAPPPLGSSFKVFGVPVRLNLSFLLVPAVIMYAPGRPVSAMLGWLVGIALAITWHEIGHAVAFKAYGHEPQIGLVGFIGFTFSERARELSERQMLVVVAAGPGASLLLAGIALFVRDTVFAGAARHPLDVFVVINVVTGLFNLLPIYPLDGGRILRSLVSMASPTHGAKAAHAVSLGIALLALVYAVNHEMQITGLLLLGTAGMNLSALRATAQRPESAAPR